ncbi:hypothetical protein HYH03_003501 [Edaphochlamys debaryana]|uniref:Uncharacterized protein n=1 Tax=Edaphochlamys debaryana TaxID=47281 RepID=A0A836C4H0_9CHLO|nr:hypothetical protein HYH03_003501 [Edaphochlamys debaryana]|eukprot:KAG2498762.1 hypothetical protein HYH03_003501 [Edaphochlamys debaryana]
MEHVKASPAIYQAGEVYVLLAPVVDYSTGRIVTAKELKWATQDRSGLINSIKNAGTPAKRAWVVLNWCSIQWSRCFLPEDRVLALVPLVDTPAWRQATEGVLPKDLVQASVAWAYEQMEAGWKRGELDAHWTWSTRIYNAVDCTACGLDLLQPRRNLGNSTATLGATPGWDVEIPPAGGKMVLIPSHAGTAVKGNLGKPEDAPAEGPLELDVLASFLMPHPGQSKYWGEGPWKFIRDAIKTDEIFRLSVQWALEPWLKPALRLDTERAAVAVVSGGCLPRPLAIIMGVPHAPQADAAPSRGKVMLAFEVDVSHQASLLKGLTEQALAPIPWPIVAKAPAQPTPSGPADAAPSDNTAEQPQQPEEQPEEEQPEEENQPEQQEQEKQEQEEKHQEQEDGPLDTGLVAPAEGTAITKGGEPGAIMFSGTEVAAAAGVPEPGPEPEPRWWQRWCVIS